jgi:hypothetical protein
MKKVTSLLVAFVAAQIMMFYASFHFPWQVGAVLSLMSLCILAFLLLSLVRANANKVLRIAIGLAVCTYVVWLIVALATIKDLD